MKHFLAFLALAVGLAAAPTTPISNANIQLNGVSQSGVLAANSTGAANVTAAQFSAALDLLGSTRGSLLYRGASGWTILTPGSAGSALESGGAGADPIWGSGSTGTVTTFSAGNLSPLFTTNVANPTTAPALTFALSNAAANVVLAGPTSGSAAAPTYRALVAADLPAGTGSVTSVGLSLPSIITVTGSPVTTTGTLTGTLATQSANLVWAGPTTGSAAAPTFRSLVAADILPINLASSANGGVTGNLPVGNLNSGTSAGGTTFWRGDGTWATPAGTGVTAVSIATANGLAGSSSGGATPALTLSTTITGILKGNGTAISAAASGTDYAPATTGAFVLTGNSAGGFTNTDLTYSTPTLSVPDAFNISSAGSISMTAGGAAKNVTFKSSTTGNIVGNLGGVASTFVTAPRFQGLQLYAGQDVRTSFYLDTVGTQTPTFSGRHAKITTGALSGVVSGDVLAAYGGEGYGATGYVNSRPGMQILADDTWTDSVAGSKIILSVVLKGGTTAVNSVGVNSDGSLSVGGNRTIPAWSTSGPLFRSLGTTLTDSSSATGTVATAVFNSFAAPTINATNASVVYTDLFNLYAVAPLTTGNASATRAHTLGIVDSTSAASSITGGLVISTTLGTTATSVGIGGGNVNAGGTLTVGGTSTLTGAVTQTAKTTTYNNIATNGNGIPSIIKKGRVTAQSAANASIATYTAPAADGSYEVSANMNVTGATALSTTLTCTYTDESNTARTMILPVQQLSGSFIAGGLITGTGAWETPVMHIRVKASTAITILTAAGTFTGVTYTAEGIIKQTD